TIEDNASLEFASNSDQTINNSLYGNGSVIKSGSGTVTLNGYNSYYGETTITGGKLVVPKYSSLSSTKTTVNSGATLQTGGGLYGALDIETGGNLEMDVDPYSYIYCDTLTLNGGRINFDFYSVEELVFDYLGVSSANLKSGIINLNFNESSVSDWRDAINLYYTDGLRLINGTIENYATFNSGAFSVYVNGSPSSGWTLTTGSGGSGLFLFANGDTPTPGDDYWYYANTNDIYAGSWTIDGSSKYGAKLVEGDNHDVTYSNPVQMNGNGTFQVAANYNLTLAGGLSGSGALTKTDAGKLTITTANGDFTGDTTVSGGTLELSGAGTLGSTTINVGAGATMLYNNTVPHNTSPLTFNINGGTLEFYNDTTTTAGHNANIAICSGLSGQDVTINGTGGTLLIDGGGCVAALNSNASTVTFALDANSTIYVKSGYFVNGGYATQNWDNNQATLHIGETGKVELWDGKQMKVGGLIGETGAQLLETKGGNGITIGNGTTSNQNFVYNGTIALNGKTLTKVGDGTQVLNGNISNAKISSTAGTLVLGVEGNEINIGTNSLVKTDGGAVRVDGNIVVDSSYLSAGGDWTGNGNITVNSGTMRIYGTFSYPKGITLNGGTLFNDGDSDGSATGKGIVNSPVIVNADSKIQCGWSSSKSGELTLAGGLYGNGNLTVNSDSNMGWINITGTGDYGGSLILKGKVRIGGSGQNIGTKEEPASAAPFIGSKEIQMDGGQLHNYDAYLTFPNDLNFVSDSTVMAGWNKDIT
ncbi:MAG: autotransporter-associated beta strand repeat-containing protein, partial [Thermoguttaceae bacterium]|nr:autotransporter-associated beta strand repeat-containing protein [Thermoguttaceae bacterium]